MFTFKTYVNLKTIISGRRALSSSQADEAPRSKSRGAGGLLAASVAAQACTLLRYTALARLLGPQQLGMAATLALTASFFELLGDMSSDRFLIQDRHGDEPGVQAMAQLAQIGRGLVIGLAFIAFSGPVAAFFKAPQLALALCILALSPLINGFTHLDIKRVQRDHDFRPEGLALVCAEVLSLIATVAAAFLTRSFVAILYGMVIRSLTAVIVSHLCAQRPYAVGFSRAHARRLGHFAMPLLLNGPLLFFGSQGDRVIIGRQVGLAELGHYSAVLLLIFYPSAMLARFIQTTSFPLLAGARDQGGRLDVEIGRLSGQVILLAILMCAGFAVVAPVFISLVFGPAFTQAPQLIALVGMLQTSRFLIVWPTAVSLAIGRSANILVGNVVRLLVVPSAIAGHWLMGGLTGVIIGFIVGEIIAFAIALGLMNRSMGAPLLSRFSRPLLFCCLSLVVVGWAHEASGATVWAMAGLILSSAVLGVWLVRSEASSARDLLAMGFSLVGIRTARTGAPSKRDGFVQ